MYYKISLLIKKISFFGIIIFNCFFLKAQPTEFLKGRAFEIKGQPDSAILCYSKILDKNKTDAKVYVARGRAFYENKELDKAISDFIFANKINGNIADFNLAQCYARQNNIILTIESLKNHLTSKYKLPQVIVRLDPEFEKFDDNPEWKNFWKKDWYDKYDNQIGEVSFMTKNKDWMGVINYISDAIKIDTKHHEMLYFRANAYHEMGNYKTSLNDYDNAIDLNKHKYEYFEGRANSYIKLGKLKEAVTDLNFAITIAPDVFTLYIKRAETNFFLFNYDIASADIDFYLSLFANDTTAIFLAGQIAQASGNFFDALSYYNRLIKFNPLNAGYYLSRAETYEKTGLVPFALKDYNTCINLEPQNKIALRKRGQILFNQGNKKSACLDWEKAMNYGDFEANNFYLDNCK